MYRASILFRDKYFFFRIVLGISPLSCCAPNGPTRQRDEVVVRDSYHCVAIVRAQAFLSHEPSSAAVLVRKHLLQPTAPGLHEGHVRAPHPRRGMVATLRASMVHLQLKDSSKRTPATSHQDRAAASLLPVKGGSLVSSEFPANNFRRPETTSMRPKTP